MQNYDVFEQYLEFKNLRMEKLRDDDCVFFRTEQRTDSGATVLVVASFYDNSNIVEVEVYNIARLNSPLKEDKFLYLINELNNASRFTKFLLTKNNDIKLFYSYLTDSYFTEDSAQKVIDTMIMMLRSADESYPKFMKLLWA